LYCTEPPSGTSGWLQVEHCLRMGAPRSVLIGIRGIAARTTPASNGHIVDKRCRLNQPARDCFEDFLALDIYREFPDVGGAGSGPTVILLLNY
jgi:hypothetical protein